MPLPVIDSNDPPRLLSVGAAAQRLGVSVATIQKLTTSYGKFATIVINDVSYFNAAHIDDIARLEKLKGAK